VAEALVHAEEIGKTYGTVVKTVALHDVSFEIEAGEFASVIGQSGSGKSTLLNLIGLLDTPTTGRIVLNGHDATAANRKQRAALRNDFVGFVFQFHYLLPEFSVLENVLMPGRIAGVAPSELVPRAEENLALLGLEGLEKKNANDLSGGQKQRVAIARALASQPDVLLCDEPTSALDAETTESLLATLRDINAQLGVTIVIVTHELSVVTALCRNAVVVEDGRIADRFDLESSARFLLVTRLGRDLLRLRGTPEPADRGLELPLKEAARA